MVEDEDIIPRSELSSIDLQWLAAKMVELKQGQIDPCDLDSGHGPWIDPGKPATVRYFDDLIGWIRIDPDDARLVLATDEEAAQHYAANAADEQSLDEPQILRLMRGRGDACSH